MTQTSREKIDLVNRTKKIIGQLESALRGLNEDEQCADVLQRLSAARGAINALMGELLEDHIRHHMPRNSRSSEEAAEDVFEMVGTSFKYFSTLAEKRRQDADATRMRRTLSIATNVLQSHPWQYAPANYAESHPYAKTPG